MAKKAKKTEKLSKQQIEDLKGVGITGCKTLEDSREAMVEKLSEQGIDDEGESWDELYEICLTLFGDDIQNDDLADEVDSGILDEDEEDEDEDDEDEDEEDDEDEDDEEAEDNIEDIISESEDEEDEEDEPVKKSSKKSKTEKPAKAKKPAKTEKKKPKAKTTGKRLMPKDNPEDAARYEGFFKAVKKLGDFTLNFLTNGGCSVIHNGENSKKVLLSFDSPKLTDAGIIGRVYIPTLRDEERLHEVFGEDYEIKTSWSGNKLVVNYPLEELINTFKNSQDDIKEILGGLKKKDERLGKNRKKMEDQLKETQDQKVDEIKAKSKAKKASKKAKAKPEVEEAVEPVKKVKKKTKKSKK